MPSEISQSLPVQIIGSTDMLDLERLAPSFADRDAQEFAKQARLEGPLSRAIKLISDCFRVVAPLVVELDDSDADPSEWGLVVSVPVSGDPAEISRAQWNYALMARALLGVQAERIAVICDIR